MRESDFFADVAVELHSAPTPEETIERIVEYAKSAVGCHDAGILLIHARNQIETAAATSHIVGEAHNLQILYDEGPCLDAMETREPYLSPNTAEDQKYPRWGKAVADLGLLSALSVPLATKERVYGSLNLYCLQTNKFDEDDLAVAKIFARHASVAWASAHNEEGLQLAIDARKLIGQAQGILMERFDIDADRAFEFLRRHSQHRNIKLRTVAEWVVENRHSSLQNPEPPADN